MGSIHRKVNAVLVLYDAFNNRLAFENGMKVITEQGIIPIRKGNGCYVFMEEASFPCLDILIESPFYQSKRLRVIHPKAEMDVKNVSVRLYPGKKYPFSKETTFLLGKIGGPDDAGGQMAIILREEAQPIRLMNDYRKGDLAIALFGVGEETKGQECVILESELPGREETHWAEQSFELFALEEQVDGLQNAYGLRGSLPHSYRRNSSIIRRIYRAEVESDGSYFAAFREVPKEGTECLVKWEMQGVVKEQAVRMLVFGKKNE